MILILGGGLSGLQLGRRLQERGVDFLVLEARAEAGGLCRTLRRGEHSWDVGPHAFYSKKPEAMAHYRELPVSYAALERNVRVCHRAAGRVYEVGYPFENGLADLPLGHRLECAAGYCWAALRRGKEPFRHLRHWIEDGLGGGIARRFMLPYNEKIWSQPLERISMDLVSQKIEPESPWAVLRHSLVSGSVGRAYQARFIYPESGGAGAVPLAVAAKIAGRVRAGTRVKRLERTDKGWRARCESGDSFMGDRVVSTIPLPELLDALGDESLSRRRGEFCFNDTLFVAVGLKPGRAAGAFARCQWVFFAGPEVFYRATLTRNFAAEGPATIVAEITANGAAGRPSDPVGGVLDGLRQAGVLASQEDVAFAEAWLEPYTYPIQTVGLREARASVEGALAERGVHLLGRMGRWDYVNTDGVFLGVDRFLAENPDVNKRLRGS